MSTTCLQAAGAHLVVHVCYHREVQRTRQYSINKAVEEAKAKLLLQQQGQQGQRGQQEEQEQEEQEDA